MKTLIQLVVVALIFGGLSAAGTVFWKQRTGTPIAAGSETAAGQSTSPDKAADVATDDKAVDTDSDQPDDLDAHAAKKDQPTSAEDVKDNPFASTGSTETHAGVSSGSVRPDDAKHATSGHIPVSPRGEPPIAIRPPYTPDGDEAGALINLLRDRARAAGEKDRRIAERQEAIKLIFDDLRADQAQTLKLRAQLTKELQQSRQAVDTALQGIDAERDALRKQQAENRKATEDALRAASEEQEKLRKQLAKATSPTPENGPASDPQKLKDDNANLKKMAAVFDGMPAENVAKIFQQLVKNKRPDAVVWLMNSMKERQTAKVLGVIAETTAELAADLSDRLKRLKTTPVPPVVEPMPPSPE